ncbi:hypothetical protein EFK22_09220 [Lactococcus lactis subsp. lactis]|uniref:DUF4428 domain-containing protein n=1 Tax=Lactococcus lactis TaxID=1358 RepID=UPI001F0D0DFB|nr:DUF4428 domain-containing protein [Lactococcus lactis]MCH5425278.1 hypothetical protein [Lactococcus lactis]MCT0030298.1 hypothetical protein [Lactococcus lactis subsp. lactis]MCT0059545.1 hypothetical protein [Lactococcus lactis subsp. lactis]
MGKKECGICNKKIGALTAHYNLNNNNEIVCADCMKLLGYDLRGLATKPLLFSKILSSLTIEQLISGEAHKKIEDSLLEAKIEKNVKKDTNNSIKQDKKLAKKGAICSKCHSHNVISLGAIQKGNFGIIRVGSNTKAFKMMCNDCGHKWEIKN